MAISDAELKELPLPTAKAIEIQAFVPLESIDPIRIAESYYLVPDGQVAAKPYELLRQALDRSSKAAIAKYAWSGRERLGLLRTGAEHLFRDCRIPEQEGPSDPSCVALGRANSLA